MADASLAGRRILIVEDEFFMATDLADAFAQADAEVVGPVASVGQALALIALRPDIAMAVLDVNLGGDLVFPVADRLNQHGVPFLFSTGYDARVIPARFADVPRLEKPIEADDVVRAVSRSLDAGRSASSRAP